MSVIHSSYRGVPLRAKIEKERPNSSKLVALSRAKHPNGLSPMGTLLFYCVSMMEWDRVAWGVDNSNPICPRNAILGNPIWHDENSNILTVTAPPVSAQNSQDNTSSRRIYVVLARYNTRVESGAIIYNYRLYIPIGQIFPNRVAPTTGTTNTYSFCSLVWGFKLGIASTVDS